MQVNMDPQASQLRHLPSLTLTIIISELEMLDIYADVWVNLLMD